MSRIVVCSVILVLTFLSHGRAQERSPHGLAYENPTAFSPSAYDFFHPDAGQSGGTKNSCSNSGCSPIPLAAHFDSSHESRAKSSQRHGGIGAGAIAAILSGFVFVILLGMGAYYVATTRRANTNRGKSVQPDV